MPGWRILRATGLFSVGFLLATLLVVACGDDDEATPDAAGVDAQEDVDAIDDVENDALDTPGDEEVVDDDATEDLADEETTDAADLQDGNDDTGDTSDVTDVADSISDGATDTDASDTSMSMTVGADGGTVNGPNGVTLVIPAGALTADVEFTISLATVESTVFQLAGNGYEFQPHGTTFAVAATITLPYDETGLGMFEDDVLLWWGETASTGWAPLVTVIDKDANTVESSILELSFGAPGLELNCLMGDCGADGYCEIEYACAGLGVCRERPSECVAGEQVCGCDGVNYDSACAATQNGTGVAYVGDCATGGCSTNDQCGAEGYCALPTGVCFGAGTCMERTVAEECSATVVTVCGCDETEYDHACLARAAGINLAYTSECPTLTAPFHRWSTSIGGSCDTDCVTEGVRTGRDVGNDIARDAEGNIYVIGNFEGETSDGDITLDNAGRSDVFVARYDADGTLDWLLTFGGTGADTGEGVAVDESGALYITGSFGGDSGSAGTINFGAAASCGEMTTVGGNDIYLVKFTPTESTAAAVWCAQFGDTDEQAAHALAVNASHVLITGEFRGDVDFTDDSTAPHTSAGESDVFLASFALDGTFVWSLAAGDDGNQMGTALVTQGANNVYLGGTYTSIIDFDTPLVDAGDSQNGFIAVFDDSTSGSHVWSRGYGEAPEDDSTQAVYDIYADDNGLIYFTGSFEDSLVLSDTKTLYYDGVYYAVLSPDGDDAYTVWGDDFYGTWSQEGYGITADSDGNIYLGGSYYYDINLGNGYFDTDTNDFNIFVAQFEPDDGDDSYDLTWAQWFGGTQDDFLYAISVGGPDDIYVTGSYRLNMGFGPTYDPRLTSEGAEDCFLGRLANTEPE